MHILCAGLSTEIETSRKTCKKCAQEIKFENLRQKNQSQDKMNHSIYETFRLKLKSLSIYKNHDVRIVERPSI